MLYLESAVYLHGHNYILVDLYRELSVRCHVSVEIYQQYSKCRKLQRYEGSDMTYRASQNQKGCRIYNTGTLRYIVQCSQFKSTFS